MKLDENEYARTGVFGREIVAAANATVLDFVVQTIIEKAEQRGVTLNRRQIRSLRSQLEQGVYGNEISPSIKIRSWPWWKYDVLEVEFSEQDQQRLDALIDGLSAEVPGILQETLGPISEHVCEDMKKSWPAYKRAQNKDQSGFLRRLSQTWGGGLSLLEMLVTIAIEVGSETLEFESNQTTLDFCHSRLHARACQIAQEAIVLMRYGFADGAMARWRTLHEVVVVMEFLREHGEEVAKGYVDHQVVESWKAAQLHQEKCTRLGQDPFSDEELRSLKKEYDLILQKYGKEFRKDYGWAAVALGNKPPNFAEIEKSIRLDHLRPYYKLASHNVHANPKGAFFRIGTLGEEVLLAGPSNAGIADPGHIVALSLHQATVFLVSMRPSYNHLVAIKIMERLTDEIGAALLQSHRKVERAAQGTRLPALGSPCQR